MDNGYGGGVLQGAAQTAQAMQAVDQNKLLLQQQQQEFQRQQQMNQRQDEGDVLLEQFTQGYQAGRPDYNLLVTAAYKSPKTAQNVLAGIGIVDKQQKTGAANDIVTGIAAAKTKDKKSMMQWGAKRIAGIKARGGDPTDTQELVKKALAGDWDGVSTSLMTVGAALANEGYIKPEIIGFGRQAEPMSAFQQASTDLRKQELELDKAQKATELKLKTLEAAMKREDNDLKRQDLALKIKETEADLEKKQQDLDAAQKKKESSNMLLAETYNVANELLGAENLDNIVGTVDISLLPTVRPESQDLINKASRLQSLLTVDNLQMMSGVLTDKDIAFLTNVGSGLNVTEAGIKGSVGGVKTRLKEIASKIEAAAKAKGVKLDAAKRNEQDIFAEYGL